MPRRGGEKKPRGGSIAARIRAAAAYADLDRKALGKELGYSVETVSAIYAGEKTPDREERNMIADVTGVPRAFMDVGFAPLAQPLTDTERRLFALEERVARIDGLSRHGEAFAETVEGIEHTREPPPTPDTTPDARHRGSSDR